MLHFNEELSLELSSLIVIDMLHGFSGVDSGHSLNKMMLSPGLSQDVSIKNPFCDELLFGVAAPPKRLLFQKLRLRPPWQAQPPSCDDVALDLAGASGNGAAEGI